MSNPRAKLPDLEALALVTALLRRHLGRATLTALAGLGIGIGLVAVAPTAYESTAAVLAEGTPSHLDPGLPDPNAPSGSTPKPPRTRTPDTEAQLLVSGSALDDAGRRLGSTFARELQPGNDPTRPLDRHQLARHIRLSALPNTRVLNITFTAPTAQLARQGAQAIAEAYVRERSAALTARANRVTDDLWKRRDSLARQADSGADGNHRLAASLASQVRDLDTAIATVGASAQARTAVVHAATAPKRALRGNAEIPPTSGLAGGALVGLAWGYARDRRSPRIRDADQVRRDLGLPVFARLGTRSRLRELATEVRLAGAHRVLVTGLAPHRILTGLGDHLEAALGYVDDPAEVLVAAASPASAYTLARARDVDLVLLVARIGQPVESLASAARLLSRAGTPSAVVLAPRVSRLARFSPTRRARRVRRVGRSRAGRHA